MEDISEACVDAEISKRNYVGPWVPFIADCQVSVADKIKKCSLKPSPPSSPGPYRKQPLFDIVE